MPDLRIEARIEAGQVESLMWSGESLIDWLGGVRRFELDGSTSNAWRLYQFSFDTAVASQSGRYVFIYQRLGTKGLMLCDGSILREINRSNYYAHSYAYPVCFATLADGREVLIHCPEDYRRLEIEDAATGERLTMSKARSPSDFFHWGLQVDPSNAWLISLGWFWPPFDSVRLFSIDEAIEDPASLDDSNLFPVQPVEISSAFFRDDGCIVVSTAIEDQGDDPYEAEQFEPMMVGVWDIATRSIRSKVVVSEFAGNVMPINDKMIVAFHEHPKLVNLCTGEITCRLPEFACGQQRSSVSASKEMPTPIAYDLANKRFAVATKEQVVVVQYVD